MQDRNPQRSGGVGAAGYVDALRVGPAGNRVDRDGPEITAVVPRHLGAAFAALAGRDQNWIADQIGHATAHFTFSVYEQVHRRRSCGSPTNPPTAARCGKPPASSA